MLNSLRLTVRKENKVQAINETSARRESDPAQLLERAAGGDYEAFGQVYTIYLDRIYRYVFHQLNDKMAAEDLTEETFVKAWRAMGAFRGGTLSFSAWLYRIAHNQVIDHFRARQPHVSLDSEALGNAEIVDNIVDPEQEAERNLMQQEVLELVSYLPPDQKQLIILKFIEGLDNQEIEEITGKSQGAIRVMQMRALAALRQRLSKEQSEDRRGKWEASFSKPLTSVLHG